MVVFGPTGAGKSATLNYLSMLVMAIHRPRLVIADAGKSFDLMVKDMATKGLSVHRVNLSGDTDVSLPPFVYGSQLLQDKEIMESFKAAEEYFGAGRVSPPKRMLRTVGAERLMESVNEVMEPADADDDSDEEKRDYLGEMLISAIMMITGGEDAELKRMTRADRYLVTRAIIRAAVRVSKEGKPHPLTQDVALELTAMVKDASLSEHRRSRAEEMGHSMMSFTTGLRGKLFNRLGQDWPDADVTLVEMGTLTKDGYEDALAVAYTSLLDSVQSRAEAAQHEDRPLIMLTDEGRDYHQRAAWPEGGQGHQDVAKAQCLVLVGHAKLEGLPRQYVPRAVHVRVLDAADHGQERDRGDRALSFAHTRATPHDGVCREGAG